MHWLIGKNGKNREEKMYVQIFFNYPICHVLIIMYVTWSNLYAAILYVPGMVFLYQWPYNYLIM